MDLSEAGEWLGNIWVRSLGSLVLSFFAALVVHHNSQEHGRYDALRGLASLAMHTRDGLTTKQLVALARAADSSYWHMQQSQRHSEWASYVAAVCAAPAIAEGLGYVKRIYDDLDDLSWVRISNFEGLVTAALLAFIVIRVFAYVTYRRTSERTYETEKESYPLRAMTPMY